MRRTTTWVCLAGIVALLWGVCPKVAAADEKKGSDEKKVKKETRYDRLFKDKRRDTARSTFITLHKTDGKLYAEIPLKYLGREMMLGGSISSVTDPTYVTVGMKNFAPLHFYFERQDSSLVMKTPNAVLYNDGTATIELRGALTLSYRDPVMMGFKIEAYNNDSSAVVVDVTSLLAKPNSMLPLMPQKSGDFAIRATPKSEMSYVRSIKSFEGNIVVNVDFNYLLTALLMSIPVANEIPTTVGATYSLVLLPESGMRPRQVDSRVGIASSSKMTYANDISKSRRTYLAHRWHLVPRNLKAYAQRKGSEPVKKIRFYLDNAFPETWKEPVRRGVDVWNRTFEKAGFRNVLEVVDFPKDDPSFDPDNILYSCIRYVPNGSENPTSSFWVNPTTGEILNASIFVYSNVGQMLHRWRFVGTAAADASVRSSQLPADQLAEGLTYLVAREVGHSLGLLDNFGASSTYPVDSLRNAAFTHANGLAASLLSGVNFNYVAQTADRGVRLMPTAPGVYDQHAIEWNYRYFDPQRVSAQEEAAELEKWVDQRVKNPRLRYFRTSSQRWDPRVQEGALGNNALRAANYGIANLCQIEKHLYDWVKNDEDSRIKEKLYLTIAQQHYAYFKRVMSNVGGILLNDMKFSSGVPRYQVVDKDLQRKSLQWCLWQAKRFKSYADKNFERRGFISVSYYDQLLEFIGYDLLGARTRLAVSSHLAPESYTQKEYFADLFNGIFQSVIEGKAPSQEERVLQRTYLTYSRAVVDKANKQGGNGPAALQGQGSLQENLPKENFLQEHFLSSVSRESASSAYGDPNASLSPTVDAALLDHSALYFYSSLLRLKPLLEKCLKGSLPADAQSHYQMLLFRLNKALEDGK